MEHKFLIISHCNTGWKNTHLEERAGFVLATSKIVRNPPWECGENNTLWGIGKEGTNHIWLQDLRRFYYSPPIIYIYISVKWIPHEPNYRTHNSTTSSIRSTCMWVAWLISISKSESSSGWIKSELRLITQSGNKTQFFMPKCSSKWFKFKSLTNLLRVYLRMVLSLD